MRLRGWLRAFSKERDAASGLAAFSRSAAAGDSLERLVELAVEELLKTVDADRAGVWLETDTRQVFRGIALDARGQPAPAEWQQLDISAFAWKNVVRTSTPLIADLPDDSRRSATGGSSVEMPPVLAEMRSAVWWPVRFAGRAVGVALLAFRASHASVSESASPFVWALLNQLALAYHAQHTNEALTRMRGDRPERGELCDAPVKTDERSAVQGRLAPRAEQHVAEEMRALLEAVDSGVLLLDASGRIRSLNQQFVQLFGLDEGAVGRFMGGDINELHESFAPLVRDPDTFSRRWRELPSLGNSTAWDEVELVSPAGRVLQRFSRPVFGALGQCLGWLELYRERSAHTTPYMPMLQTEKMAAIGQLVSGIAHELNNPLTSIMGYAQLLLARSPRHRAVGNERRRDSESTRDMLREAENIYLEAERAGRIVNNLLLFARSGRGERRAADLNEIVERTLALRSYELKIENIHLELELDPSLPPTLADPHQVQQVVLNLLVNAEQSILESHAAERSEAAGGSELSRIRMRTFSLSDAQPPRVGLEISDSGPGVAPQHVSRLFDPFFTTKPIGLGTGLGLSIAYGIVHDHGGDIYLVDSAKVSPGAPSLGGATFVVELPVLSVVEGATAHPNESGDPTAHEAGVAPPREPEAGLAEKSSPAGATHPRRESVLVVEDEPTVAQLIADVLKDDGYRVDVVLDSREGLLRVARFGYDLIICDLRMPRIDGRAFYRSLVRSGHPAQLRMLFVTGDKLSPRTLDFLDRTGLPCLAKPFLVEELKSIVAGTLDSLRTPHEEPHPKRRATDFDDADEIAPHPDAIPSSPGRRVEEARKQ